FGKLTTHDYIPQLSVDSLFTNHMAILGNTGSGKSTTMRKILNELLNLHSRGIDPNKMNFIIFDLHNEYTIFANEYLTPVNLDEISIPLDTLNLEDWINLVQPAMSVQLPVLMNGLKMASILESDSDRYGWIKAYCALELYNNQQTDAVTKRTKIVNLLENIQDENIKSNLVNYSSQYGSVQQGQEESFTLSIYDYLKDVHDLEYHECDGELRKLLESTDEGFKNLLKLKDGVDMVLLLEESKGNTQARTHCETLMTRIDNIILNYSSNLFSNNRDRINKFYEIIKYEKALTVFDCSNLEDSDLLFLSGYFSREILELQREVRKNGNLNKSFNIILDEAHRYITEHHNDDEKMKTIKVFDKLAKEGRKFGVFITVASQRPSELSKTVLSQCNNFIIHRIR